MAIIPALMPVLYDTEKQGGIPAAVASVTIPVPNGIEILFLEWANVGCSDNLLRFLQLTAVSGAGGYDWSRQLHNAASNTNHTANFLVLGEGGDADGVIHVTNGEAVIFNRAGSEKVMIGRETYYDNSAGGAADETLGSHIEGKDRDTSDPITSLVISFAAGNILANSRFILRGLRTDKAPALGSKDIVQFIGSTEPTTGSSFSFTVPSGYEQLLLFWDTVYGDSNSGQEMRLTFNSDGGAYYDHSDSGLGSASSTENADTNISMEFFGDLDGEDRYTYGYCTIFNRKGQEKVLIGPSIRFPQGGAGPNDLLVFHREAKWRNKEDEISTITLTASVGNFATPTKVWLLGVKI